jgi:hypothetical protein
LTDAEYAAVRALQDGASAPPATDPLWEYPLSAGLVWIDKAMRPATVRLTRDGRRYPAD